MIQGWYNKDKGSLQVLYERGMINMDELGDYSLKGKKHQKDENQEVMEEYKPYLLVDLMENCADSKNEKSTMEHLFEQLAAKGENNIHLIMRV